MTGNWTLGHLGHGTGAGIQIHIAILFTQEQIHQDIDWHMYKSVNKFRTSLYMWQLMLYQKITCTKPPDYTIRFGFQHHKYTTWSTANNDFPTLYYFFFLINNIDIFKKNKTMNVELSKIIRIWLCDRCDYFILTHITLKFDSVILDLN